MIKNLSLCGNTIGKIKNINIVHRLNIFFTEKCAFGAFCGRRHAKVKNWSAPLPFNPVLFCLHFMRATHFAVRPCHGCIEGRVGMVGVPHQHLEYGVLLRNRHIFRRRQVAKINRLLSRRPRVSISSCLVAPHALHQRADIKLRGVQATLTGLFYWFSLSNFSPTRSWASILRPPSW